MGKFDGGLKEGDLVRAFHAGIWRVAEIERRYATENDFHQVGFEGSSGAKEVGDEYNALIHCERVLDGAYYPVPEGTRTSCDLYYCSKVSPDMIKDALGEQGRIDEWKPVAKALGLDEMKSPMEKKSKGGQGQEGHPRVAQMVRADDS